MKIRFLSDEELVKLFSEFLENRRGIQFYGKPMPFHWLSIPREFDLMEGFGMSQYTWCDLAEFQSHDISNAINSLAIHIRNFDSWHQVIESLDDEGKIQVINEFIESDLIVALSLPYSIKQRFYFALSHLSHQANRFLDPTNWKETDLPEDSRLNQETAARMSRKWKKWRAIAAKLDRCDGSAFRSKTMNYRNRYTHHHGIFVGATTALPAQRRINPSDSSVYYVFGGSSELKLSEVANLLRKEFDYFSAAYSKFQDFLFLQRDVVLSKSS